MHKLFIVFINLIITMSLLPDSFTQAANIGKGPPFKSGEVVVAGAPGPHLAGLGAVKYLPRANITVVKVDKGREFGTVQRFMTHGRKASLNYIAHATNVPNDQYYPDQWNFAAIRSEEAWNLSSGSGVIVAVLDTGIAAGGNDGIGCIVTPRDIINEDDYPDDGDGHGTHVSGTIAQTTGNGTGVAGLAYNACIMPVKVLDDTGTGYFSDIADGVYYAVDNGAKVINMSLGTDAGEGFRNIPFMDAALEYAYQNNVTVVCSSGNEGSLQNVSYPAIYPTTIAVGATDFNNNVTQYSNKGEGLDIVAPGGNISKDLNHDGNPDGVLQETLLLGSWGYYFYEGTSMAAPHVSAVAALFLATDSALTPSLLYQIITATALDLNGTGHDTTSGYGLLQAYTDADVDQMADSWEISYGLNPDDPSDAYSDKDGDGIPNLDEYNCGLNPEDPTDVYFDHDSDGLTSLDEYNLGFDPQNPDTDNDGFLDSYDGDPLDDQVNLCAEPVRNNFTLEVFSTVQGAVDDPGALDDDMIQITSAEREEDILYDQINTLVLSGGYYCGYSDNPLKSSINSLKVRNGTIVIDNIVIKPPIVQ